MSIETNIKIIASVTSWRQALDRSVQQAGGRLISMQSYLEPTKMDLFVRNPETDNILTIPFNPLSFVEGDLQREIHKAIEADNAKSEARRVSVKAGLLAEKATILANMAKTLSELSLELDALAERKKQ